MLRKEAVSTALLETLGVLMELKTIPSPQSRGGDSVETGGFVILRAQAQTEPHPRKLILPHARVN